MLLLPKIASIKQILPPLVIRASHEPHDVTAGVEIEGAGLAHQLHAGFAGELIALAAIAGMATSHKVLPSRGASARAWHHVIEREFAGRQHFATKLTGVAITQQNVLARKRTRLVRNSPILQQSNH